MADESNILERFLDYMKNFKIWCSFLLSFSNLEYLLLYDFPAVKNKDAVVHYLQERLPNCTILFTYASDVEQQQLQRQLEQKQKQEKEKDSPEDNNK